MKSVATRVLHLTATLVVLIGALHGWARPCHAGDLEPVDLAGTAISYTRTGMKFGGVPLDGTYDFRFKLFDAASDGNQVGPTIDVFALNINNGVLPRQTLNFGEEAFTGEAIWIDVKARQGVDPFALIGPRQRFRPVPYALALPGMRTIQNEFSPCVIGGWPGNTVAADVIGATIGGGGGSLGPNSVTADFGTVGGGFFNQASGLNATVPGGISNIAQGSNSFAAGSGARALHDGSFVWSDGAAVFASTAADQFLIRAAGGVGIGTNNPGAQLAVFGNSSTPVPHLYLFESTSNDYARLSFKNASGSTFWSVAGFTSATTGNARLNFFHNLVGDIMSITGQGRVGIGTSNPTHQLTLSLNSAAKPTSNTWTVASDARLKKNVHTLQGSLDKLMELRGVSYQWIDPASQGGMDGTYCGFIAQEVEAVFPEWIGEDLHGYKNLTVTGFEALAVEALRELRTETDRQIALRDETIARQQAQIDQQQAQTEAIVARLERLERSIALERANSKGGQ